MGPFKYRTPKQIKECGEHEKDKKAKIKRRQFMFMNEEDGDLISIFNNFKECVSDGAFVLLRKMDNLYPCCYDIRFWTDSGDDDIFNQRYAVNPKTGVKTCKMNLGSLEEEVEVNENFKCVILIDNDQAIDNVEKEWPTALLNRFEKHELLKFDFYTKENQEVEHLLTKKIGEFSKCVSEHKFIHNFSPLLIESAVIGDVSSVEKFKDVTDQEYLRDALDESKHQEMTSCSSDWYRDIFSGSQGNTMMNSQVSIQSQDSFDHPIQPSDEKIKDQYDQALEKLHKLVKMNGINYIRCSTGTTCSCCIAGLPYKD